VSITGFDLSRRMGDWDSAELSFERTEQLFDRRRRAAIEARGRGVIRELHAQEGSMKPLALSCTSCGTTADLTSRGK